MKRCPKCGADYFDNMLEFCLDDGVRLSRLDGTVTATSPPVELADRPSQETVVLAGRGAGSAPIAGRDDTETVVAGQQFDAQPTAAAGGEVFAYSAIGVALAHNWWQWVYLENQYVYTIATYIFSANFLMWLMLLTGGVTLSLLALKQNRSSKLPYISLIVLAINLILFLVPRR